MGCSTLYHLAKMGVGDAILLEKNQLTSGTTWHSAAQVRALRSSQNLTRMIQYSVDLYGWLEAETGQSVGWIQEGSLSIATTPDRLTHIKRQKALADTYGIEVRAVDMDEARELWPLMNTDDVLGAYFSPGDGRVGASDVCAALAKGAKAAGAKIFDDTGVTGILTKNGRIAGVETTRGTVACEAIALCAGLWSREVAAMAGAAAPIWPCEHFYLLTKPVDGIIGNLPTLSDHDGNLYIRDDSGGLLIGCFEPNARTVDPARIRPFELMDEDWGHFEPMMANALHRLPILETAEAKMLLNGPESFTPDGSFMLGEAAETPGLFFGCGMNSMGMASGGGAGMNLAHCIVHGHTAYDLGEADAKRFAPVFNSLEHLQARIPEILGTHYEIAYPGRQRQTARNLRLLPLHAEWAKASAHMGQFLDWERPLWFGATDPPALGFGKPDWFENVAHEVYAAHEKAAIFDLSSFGTILVSGPDAEAFLNRVCANDMTVAPGRVIYTGMLNERGGYESDLTALRISDEYYRLMVGTTAIQRDVAWLRRHLRDGERVNLADETGKYATLALMGPNAARISDEIGVTELQAVRPFRHVETSINGVHVRAAKLSYVGEYGWELTCRATEALALYRALHNAGAKPAGLYAQTAMRVEKGFRAYGHELDSDVTPIEAGLDFAVAWDTDFIGRDAVLRRRDEGGRGRVVSLVFDDTMAVPLGHEPIYVGGDIVGQTTSAAFGYRVGRPVALGFVKGEMPSRAEIDIAGSRFGASVSLGPAFDAEGIRMRGTA